MDQTHIAKALVSAQAKEDQDHYVGSKSESFLPMHMHSRIQPRQDYRSFDQPTYRPQYVMPAWTNVPDRQGQLHYDDSSYREVYMVVPPEQALPPSHSMNMRQPSSRHVSSMTMKGGGYEQLGPIPNPSSPIPHFPPRMRMTPGAGPSSGRPMQDRSIQGSSSRSSVKLKPLMDEDQLEEVDPRQHGWPVHGQYWPPAAVPMMPHQMGMGIPPVIIRTLVPVHASPNRRDEEEEEFSADDLAEKLIEDMHISKPPRRNH